MRLVPILGDGNNLIHTISLENVINCCVKIVKQNVEKGIYILSDFSYTWNQMIDIISKDLGIRTYKFHIPIKLSKILVTVSEKIMLKLGIIPIITTKRLENFNYRYTIDSSKSIKEGLIKKEVVN